MKELSFRACAAVLLCAFCLSGTAFGADEKDTARPVQKEDQEKAVAELKKASEKSARHTGKIAVIKRLEALFTGKTNPVITPTREFKPRPAYISVHDLPGNDTTPARSISNSAAAELDRSITRPLAKGPRSATSTTVDLPFFVFTTFTIVPKGSVRCAQVKPALL